MGGQCFQKPQIWFHRRLNWSTVLTEIALCGSSWLCYDVIIESFQSNKEQTDTFNTTNEKSSAIWIPMMTITVSPIQNRMKKSDFD